MNDNFIVKDYTNEDKDGYIYYYDDNKILLISQEKTSIHKYSAVKITNNFIIKDKKDFIIIKDRYIVVEYGDYLLININNGEYAGIIKQKYNIILPEIDDNIKVEKYTGGMLDGFLYYSNFYNKEKPNDNLIKKIVTQNNEDEYLFNHELHINEYQFVYFNNENRKITYNDKLLMNKDKVLLDVLYKNAVSYV